MAPPPKTPSLSTYQLCFLLLVSTTSLSAATSTSYSSLCSSPPAAIDRQTEVEDVKTLTRSFQLSTGQFYGGEDLFNHSFIGHISSDGDGLSSADDDLLNHRHFMFFPSNVSRTDDSALIHLTATLILSYTSSRAHHARGHHSNYMISQSVTFALDGYFSFETLKLCMVGTGAELADGAGIALRLRVPIPFRLTDPFITGRLEGPNFKSIGLAGFVAYAEGANYGEHDSSKLKELATTTM